MQYLVLGSIKILSTFANQYCSEYLEVSKFFQISTDRKHVRNAWIIQFPSSQHCFIALYLVLKAFKYFSMSTASVRCAQCLKALELLLINAVCVWVQCLMLKSITILSYQCYLRALCIVLKLIQIPSQQDGLATIFQTFSEVSSIRVMHRNQFSSSKHSYLIF